MSKHKFFAWLILHDRISTKDMLLRRHWNVTNNHNCVLCSRHQYEDRVHLFFQCTFSQRVWSFLQISWRDASMLENLLNARKGFEGPCFTEIVILACWNIWKQRNGYIFKETLPTFRSWKAGFFVDVTLLRHRVKDSVKPLLSSWLDNLQ